MFEVVEEVSNPQSEPMEVWFEPWGMPHTLAAGQTFRIVAVSDQEGRLEIECDGRKAAVYGWPGCTLRVYSGEELIEDFSIKFPALPPGMSTKSFIGSLFGGPGEVGKGPPHDASPNSPDDTTI